VFNGANPRVIDEHPVIAGLRLGWLTFASSRPDDQVAFGLWVPDEPDITLDQLTQDEFDRTDERMPYFATVWPAAEVLLAELLAGPALNGLHALDLGCGLGACGFAAARRGAHVTFLDWEPRAIEIVRASAVAQGAAAASDFLVGDWRDPPAFGPFDLILGADVLYERRNGPAVASFLYRFLRSGAEAWIADPGRPQAAEFPEQARTAGLNLVETTVLIAPAPLNRPVTLWRLSRPR
jgi:predicted nicotinamide N-methyase